MVFRVKESNGACFVALCAMLARVLAFLHFDTCNNPILMILVSNYGFWGQGINLRVFQSELRIFQSPSRDDHVRMSIFTHLCS